MDSLRQPVGMGGRHSLFRSQRISDHIHPAGNARQAALLPQLSCAPGAAHLAGVCAAAGGGLSERAVVHRPQRVGGDQDRAVAGLHLFACRTCFISRCRRRSGPPGRWPSRSSTTLCGRRWCAGCGSPGCWRVLAAALVASPLLRHANLHWMTPTHTLIHLDGIAWGSLLAIGLHTLPLSRRAWLWMGLGGFVLGSRPRPPSPAARRILIPRWRLALPARCWR